MSTSEMVGTVVINGVKHFAYTPEELDFVCAKNAAPLREEIAALQVELKSMRSSLDYADSLRRGLEAEAIDGRDIVLERLTEPKIRAAIARLYKKDEALIAKLLLNALRRNY